MATPTLVIASSFPDIDCVTYVNRATYLCHHRGITHSILGILILSLILAGVFVLYARWRRRTERPRFWRLVVLALLGQATHIGLDGLNTYGVRPWLPFDGTWYYGDMAFIMDPWLIALFLMGSVAGCARVAGKRRRAGLAGWSVLSALCLTLFTISGRMPGIALVLWGTITGGVLVARGMAWGGRRPERWGRVAFGCVGVYLVLLAVISQQTHEVGTRLAGEALKAQGGVSAIESSTVYPGAAVPWRTRFLAQTASETLQVNRTLSAEEFYVLRAPRHLDDPELAKRGDHPVVQAWRCFARHPVVQRDGDELILDDARYRGDLNKPGWSHMRVNLADPAYQRSSSPKTK